MTLISFMATGRPRDAGVAMTLMWTTVSTSAAAITLAMIGLRMSARTNSAPPRSERRRDDVDADDPVDAGSRGSTAARTRRPR